MELLVSNFNILMNFNPNRKEIYLLYVSFLNEKTKIIDKPHKRLIYYVFCLENSPNQLLIL